MPVAALTTLGCKVNQYETERIAEDFARAGFALTDFDAAADVYVINSCSVTAAADKKSRYLARKASRTNPDALVVVTGCHSQTVIDRGEAIDGATLLVPNDVKMNTLDHVLDARPELLSYSSSPAVALPPRERRTRATLKVQDGCTHFCGFCQIPYTRKVKISRDWRELVDEAAALGESGVRELIVTGICVGAYGPDTGSSGPELAELLTKLAATPGIARIRLSSIQPIEVSEALIDAFASVPALCPHLHLSCQSGDDTILSWMNRPYRARFYAELVERLRLRIPDVAITTDLIVGYPGESRVMHENTLTFAREIGFQRTHVFRYSPRDRTHAATLIDDVTDDEKKRRHAELQAVVDRSAQEFAARFVGRTLDILVEGGEGPRGELVGHSPEYLRIAFPGPRQLIGQIVPVRLETATADGGSGELALTDTQLAARLAQTPSAPPRFVALPIAQ